MNKRIIQIKLVIVAVMTLFLYNQCGNPYQSQPTELQFTDNSVSSSSFETQGSLQAFEESVYKITTARCSACHTTQNPTHAHPDSKIAHDDVVNQFKVNFANIPSSRMVAKIRDENHGCWSGDCVADSQEMEEAVQYWADKVAEIEEDNNNNNTGNTTGDNGGNTDGNNGGTGYMEQVESVDVFEETVYPITRQRCVGCHNNLSPRHAHNDVVQAHNAVIDNGLVNFNNINASRLVQRLSVDAHQCWNGNCAANAVEMATAIQTWKDTMEAANNNNGGNTSTDPLTTNESGTVIAAINGGGQSTSNVTVQASAGNFTAPFVYSGGNNGYLWAPGGSGNNYDANANNVGMASYTVNIPTTGSYRMSGVVEAVPNNDDSFYVSIDGENFFDWHIPQASFTSQEVTTGSNRATKMWNLSAGNHTVIFKQREDNTKLRNFTIYPSTQGGSGLGPGEALLSYDLSGMLNVNEQITFQIKVMIYDDYSYKFWDPEIITTSSNVQVQNVQLLINGYYNPQHSAYTIVNSTVTPGNGSLASHALLALKDQGEAIDKISFKFGVLQISN